jgi:hypothetical protein
MSGDVVRELIAEAIWDTRCEPPWSSATDAFRAGFLNDADAALSKLAAAGYAVVSHGACIDELVANASDSLFAPQSVQDIRGRLARIESTGCPCAESPHLNALHDLAHDDVPVLISVLEAQTAEVEKLRGAMETIRERCRDTGEFQALAKHLHAGSARLLAVDILAILEQIEES